MDLAERWGISEKSARRLRDLNLTDEAMAILVAESKRYRATQMHHIAAHGKYIGGLKALGMKSRVPGRYCSEGVGVPSESREARPVTGA
jgi:hypothetical protein